MIITDHHLPGNTLPAAAIVNPNLRDCTFVLKSLASGGMAFYLMLALRTPLNDSSWFTQQRIAAQNWLNWTCGAGHRGVAGRQQPYDGTLRTKPHSRLSLLFREPRASGSGQPRDYQPCASDLGFALGPCPPRQSGGRYVNRSCAAAEFDAFNQTRREIKQGMEAEALCQAMARDKQTMPFCHSYLP